MYFRNVTRMQLERIAAKVGVRLIDAYAPPNAVGVCLRLTDQVLHRKNTNEEVAARLRGDITTSQLRKLRTYKKYQRTSASYFEANKPTARRTAAVCWHGHRDFLAAVFKQSPNAKVRTSGPNGRYYVVADNAANKRHSEFYFSDYLENTEYTNIGSQMNPICASEACLCGN